MFCSARIACNAVVHNGCHCVQAGHCSWKFCADFCKSDHFLVVMLTASFNDFFTVEHVGSNLPGFPTHWHSTERWATAFTHLAPALAVLADDLIICLGKFLRLCSQEIDATLPLRPEDGSLTACVGCNVFLPASVEMGGQTCPMPQKALLVTKAADYR